MKRVEITDLTEADLVEYSGRNGGFLRWWKKEAVFSGPCYCGRLGGEIIGLGGIVSYWAGVGEAWSSYMPWALERHKRQVFVYTKTFMEIAEKNFKYHRIQAVIREDVPGSWPKHLGFEREALLRGYCPGGGDAVMWAKVIKNCRNCRKNSRLHEDCIDGCFFIEKVYCENWEAINE